MLPRPPTLLLPLLLPLAEHRFSDGCSFISSYQSKLWPYEVPQHLLRRKFYPKDIWWLATPVHVYSLRLKWIYSFFFNFQSLNRVSVCMYVLVSFISFYQIETLTLLFTYKCHDQFYCQDLLLPYLLCIISSIIFHANANTHVHCSLMALPMNT